MNLGDGDCQYPDPSTRLLNKPIMMMGAIPVDPVLSKEIYPRVRLRDASHRRSQGRNHRQGLFRPGRRGRSHRCKNLGKRDNDLRRRCRS